MILPCVNSKRVTGHTYTFVRINPSDVDHIKLSSLIEKYHAYCGYDTFETPTTDRTYLNGFIVFPISIPQEYIQRKLSNFLVDPVRDLDKIEDRFKKSETTVWSFHSHPLKKIRIDLSEKFDAAVDNVE